VDVNIRLTQFINIYLLQINNNNLTHTTMKHPIKSIFEQIAEQVFKMTDINKAKQFITEFVESKGIKPEDKQTILTNVSGCKNIIKLQTYICNSLLKYEGMSVNTKPKEKSVDLATTTD